MPQHVVIAGGGISGLSAAYDLARAGIAHTLFEKLPRLGGVIETRCVDNCILECGPDSFLASKPEALALVKELGLEGELIGSNDHQRTTYILKHGELVALPKGVMMIVPTKVVPLVRSKLLGWKTKARMAFELLRRPKRYPDRSVAEFVIDHFGRETLDYLAEPLLSGVYGGDPRKLSAMSVLPRFVEMEATDGSLGRAVVWGRSRPAKTKNQAGQDLPHGSLFKTLASGLSTMIETLATYANIRHAEVETIEHDLLGFHVRADGEWIDASNVIVATPAPAASRLVSKIDGDLGKLLGAIPYSSSVIVSMIFDEAKFDGMRAGFGFLVPKLERDRLAACTFVATKFSHRAPEDRIVLRCFFGGVGDEAILSEPDESLIIIAREELRRILGLTAAPLEINISRWPASMAQYIVGHAKRIAEVKRRLDATGGLRLAGNAYDGIGIPDCVRSGRLAAAGIPRA